MLERFTQRCVVVAGGLLACALVSSTALADMGPSCHCSTSQQRNGRVALAGLIGAGGVAALFVERRRRSRA